MKKINKDVTSAIQFTNNKTYDSGNGVTLTNVLNISGSGVFKFCHSYFNAESTSDFVIRESGFSIKITIDNQTVLYYGHGINDEFALTVSVIPKSYIISSYSDTMMILYDKLYTSYALGSNGNSEGILIPKNEYIELTSGGKYRTENIIIEEPVIFNSNLKIDMGALVRLDNVNDQSRTNKNFSLTGEYILD